MDLIPRSTEGRITYLEDQILALSAQLADERRETERVRASRNSWQALASELQERAHHAETEIRRLTAELMARTPNLPRPGAHERVREIRAQQWQTANEAGVPLGTAWSPLPHTSQEQP